MSVVMGDYIEYTRPDGSTFTVNADESPAVVQMILNYPENAGATGEAIQMPTLDYTDYNTVAAIYGTDIADQAVKAGLTRPAEVTPLHVVITETPPTMPVVIPLPKTTNGGTMNNTTLPTPQITIPLPPDINLTTTPPAPAVSPDTPIAPPQPVTVVLGGRNRTVQSIEELQRVLDAGGSVLRADGSFAISQRVWAPGWATAGYLVDGNPLNVILGQGWMPGQRDIVDQLAQQGLTVPSTLSGQSDIGSGLPTSWLLAGGAAVLYFLFGRRRRS